jgi:hypothetical protein
VLPSKLVESGDTFDVHVATIGVGYEDWVRKHPNHKNNHSFSQAQLQEMLDNVKNAKSK